MLETAGSVYALGIAGTAWVKIGVSRNLTRRRSTLQTGMPYRLEERYRYDTTAPYQLEKALHTLLHEFHMQGEWFELPGDMDIGLAFLQAKIFVRAAEVEGLPLEVVVEEVMAGWLSPGWVEREEVFRDVLLGGNGREA